MRKRTETRHYCSKDHKLQSIGPPCYINNDRHQSIKGARPKKKMTAPTPDSRFQRVQGNNASTARPTRLTVDNAPIATTKYNKASVLSRSAHDPQRILHSSGEAYTYLSRCPEAGLQRHPPSFRLPKLYLLLLAPVLCLPRPTPAHTANTAKAHKPSTQYGTCDTHRGRASAHFGTSLTTRAELVLNLNVRAIEVVMP